MKKAFLHSVVLIVILIWEIGWTVPAHAQDDAYARKQAHDLQKSEKQREKATKKYAKAQKKAEQKMLKTEKKNSGKYKTYSYRPKAVTQSK